VTVGYGEIIDSRTIPRAGSFTMFIAPRHRQHLVFDVQAHRIHRREPFRRSPEEAQNAGSHRPHERHYVLCASPRRQQRRPRARGHRPAPGRHRQSTDAIAAFRERFPDIIVLHGDASDDDLLAKAGAARATGIFAITATTARTC